MQKAFEVCGCGARLSRSAAEIDDADALVVPGVGAFGDCIENLRLYRLRKAISRFLFSGRPYLGLCLGLQILFSSSEESEKSEGLGFFAGRIRKFSGGMKIPHMGWNTITVIGESPPVGHREVCPLFRGIKSGSYVYFVHSYYPAPDDESIIAAVTDYGGTFASAVWRDNVMATQFHPEKSQRIGLLMIRNFIDFVRGNGDHHTGC